MKKRLITSALPYVNNVPHLGNLIQVLSADCFARFCRLRGYETCYVCGTDEYGTATETRAAEEGISPRELCDRYWKIHNGIYRWFNINFDNFGRTSTPLQTEIVQDIFKKLDAAGYITEKTVEQSYCPRCERFLADRFVRGECPYCGSANARGDQCEDCGKLLDPTELKNARCSSCGTAPEVRKTNHLYIDLPKIRPLLEAWLEKAEAKGRWAKNAVQMTHAWIRDGLHERAITRDLKWGIPVPKSGYENKVFYVWFDAPIGYVSILGELGVKDSGLNPNPETQNSNPETQNPKPQTKNPNLKTPYPLTPNPYSLINSWWKDPENTELFQFIGKDNIPFHTVIFPSSQLGTGGRWTMLHHMSSTEYLNYESGKFSKSKGVGVFGTDVMETGIEADIWRFYIYYNRPEKSDTLFTWKDFAEKVNGELIGNLGNLVNRTLSFVKRYYDSKVPNAGGSPPPSPHSDVAGYPPQRGAPPPATPPDGFWETVRGYEAQITEKLEWAELRDAYRLIFELSSFANKAFQDGEPWKKRAEADASAQEEAAELIGKLCYVVRDLAILIAPFTPSGAARLAGFLGLQLPEDSERYMLSNADSAIKKDMPHQSPQSTKPETQNPKIISWHTLGNPAGLDTINDIAPLWAKLEESKVNELREKYLGDRASNPLPTTPYPLSPNIRMSLFSGVLSSNKSVVIKNNALGDVLIDAGRTGKGGFGLRRIIEQRHKKDGKGEDDITALCAALGASIEDGMIIRDEKYVDGSENDKGVFLLEKDGIIAVVSKMRFEEREQFLLTGYNSKKNERLATDTINKVISNYGYAPEFSSLKIQVGAVIGSLSSVSHNSKEKSTPEPQNPKPEISTPLPAKPDLRVAQIVKIERHPKADKLYIETLEIAGEERIIVSGLVPYYKEEDLLGKKIIVVYNLKAAKLRGVESRGMLLAASRKNEDGSETVEVLNAGDAPTGTKVDIGVMEQGAGDTALEQDMNSNPLPTTPSEIDIDTFFSVPIRVTGGTVNINGKPLCAAGSPLTTKIVLDGEVG